MVEWVLMAKNRSENRYRRLLPFCAAFIAAVLLAGCGGDDNDGVADSSSSGESSDESPDDSSTDADSTDGESTDGDSTGSSDSGGTPTDSAVSEPVTVDVYFNTGDGSDCSEVSAFPRTVGPTDDLITITLAELVAGPTAAEEEAGASSFFSADTASVLQRVALTDGLLVVDFIDMSGLIPNAGTSCGSAALLAELNNTVFQFDEVERVRYLLEGSCDDFGNWLQTECIELDRSGGPVEVPTSERASGSGCTPANPETLDDGRWYGFVDVAEADHLSFDLACWFTGEAAVDAAREDGAESPPPNDYHIRNDSDQLRTLPVVPEAEVVWLPNSGDPSSAEPVPYQTWLEGRAERAYDPGVWLVIEGGNVVFIEEQYVP
jgi:hypothetical protein